jgi:uncharacterized membrane protein YphA (DoxX/SURF4 family)
MKWAENLAPVALLVLRLTVGAEFIIKGLPKIINTSTGARLAASVHLPEFMGWAPTLLEPIGGALLILGLASRWVSLYYMAEMAVTGLVSKLMLRGVPFTIPGNQPGVGWELDALLFSAAFVLFALGPGLLALDGMLAGLRRPRLAAAAPA